MIVKVKQLAVFIENKSGRVSEVTDLLGRGGINIRGFAVADTTDYGILRLVVDDPDRACGLLRDAGVNIEYVYSLVSTYVVLTVTDPDRAVELLATQPVHLVNQEEIAAL